ncbi:hypothetical protein, partial [Bradyrhizobium sp.]|uniref:hypothetical protein n=1 Tax=Bradyrhizobium sp. TaxID=376 RepID=UPI0025B9D7B1
AEEIAVFTAFTALSVRLIIARPRCLGLLDQGDRKSCARAHAPEIAAFSFRDPAVAFATLVGFATDSVRGACRPNGKAIPERPLRSRRAVRIAAASTLSTHKQAGGKLLA